jgi:ketosteroid isomerase-like protein
MARAVADANLELVKRYYEAWERRDVDALDELCAADLVGHDPASGPDFDLDGLKQRLTMLREGLDQELASEDWLADGDLVAVRWRSDATLKGEPGRQVSWTGITIYRVRDNRIVELWHQWDNMRFLKAIGALPGDPAG